MAATTALVAPGDALYLLIAGGPQDIRDERYCNFSIRDDVFVVSSVKHKFFRTTATELMSIPLNRVKEMRITSDLSVYHDNLGDSLSQSTYVVKIMGSGLKKKNFYFVVRYLRGDGAEASLVFGANYPGPPQTNMDYIRKLIAYAAAWEKNRA